MSKRDPEAPVDGCVLAAIYDPYHCTLTDGNAGCLGDPGACPIPEQKAAALEKMWEEMEGREP